ncbi:hypothetical protein KY362_02650 [Candidatus Woesearchaeota archaeon]|nr:hypothetical protein [Candidatus Woesearchaeota archaeon]
MKPKIQSTIIISLLVMTLLLYGCGCESDEGIDAAVRAGDPNMCAELDESDSPGRVDKCYDRVAQKLKDPEVCDRIGGSDGRDDCVSGIAVRTRDGELCDSIGGSRARDECYNDVSDKTNDIELCNKISGSLKEDCIANVASNTGDADACKGLTDPDSKTDCIHNVARNSGDMDACDDIADPDSRAACQAQVAVQSGDEDECLKIERPSTRDACLEQLEDEYEQDNSCEDILDCPVDKMCKSGYCVVPECEDGTSFCTGDKREFCDKGEMHVETCIYGCFNGDCLTKEEAGDKEKEEEAEKACEEGYSVCLSDTSIEFCEDGRKIEGFCEHGCKKGKCQKEEQVDLSSTIADMKQKQEFAELLSGPYMDALQDAIDKEKDPSRLAGLEAYQTFLNDAGSEYSDAVATLEDLEKIKRIFIDSYDPSMDIENMKARDFYTQSLTEKITGGLSDLASNLWPFGSKPSVAQQEQAQAEEQLRLYEAMLERKAEIEFLKKSRVDRVGTVMVDMLKDEVYTQVSDKAKEMAEAAGGTAFATVGIVGDALQTVQDEAQNMMFTGLVKAYNRRRAALEDAHPSWDEEKIHAETVREVEDFPYTDAKTGVVIAKYGNLLANKDCTAEGNNNPLCVDRHAFWVSMDKSYAHFNDKKLYDRWLAQMQADE